MLYPVFNQKKYDKMNDKNPYSQLQPMLNRMLEYKKEYPEYAKRIEDHYNSALKSIEEGTSTIKDELLTATKCLDHIRDLAEKRVPEKL